MKSQKLLKTRGKIKFYYIPHDSSCSGRKAVSSSSFLSFFPKTEWFLCLILWWTPGSENTVIVPVLPQCWWCSSFYWFSPGKTKIKNKTSSKTPGWAKVWCSLCSKIWKLKVYSLSKSLIIIHLYFIYYINSNNIFCCKKLKIIEWTQLLILQIDSLSELLWVTKHGNVTLSGNKD